MNARDELLLETPRFQVVRTHLQWGENCWEQREVIRHLGAVTILPFLNEHQICLVRNYRLSVEKSLLELPAGTLQLNEPPRLCAERELAEETGFHASSLQELHSFYLSPGILDERMHLFLAEGLTPGPPSREPEEHIENVVVHWKDALRMAESGEIEDAKTIIGLFFYDRVVRRSTMPGST